MVRKVRVETYLHPDTVAQLEQDFEGDTSAVIRTAVNKMLESDSE